MHNFEVGMGYSGELFLAPAKQRLLAPQKAGQVQYRNPYSLTYNVSFVHRQSTLGMLAGTVLLLVLWFNSHWR